MTNPAFQANQQAQIAAQVAQASASRAAQQNAALATRLGQSHRPHYYAPRRGPLGLIGRLFSMVFTLVVLAVVAVVGLLVLTSVDPGLVEPVWHWLDRLG
ncbi:hypothetical protein ACQEVB_34765 [Pseudonocardia sp. CA-107938]|uniref:hypothetical protein n=1 Tax=Pseudonocardia sp. CA-107938 TaxID=3240021 RepID=UPI003D8CF5B8